MKINHHSEMKGHKDPFTEDPTITRRQSYRPLPKPLAILLLLTMPAGLIAGTFKLPPGSADPGTSVTVSFKDQSGGDESKTMPAGNDGSATITFDAETEKGAYDATISYKKNGQQINNDVTIPKSSVDGFNQYEPFKIPEFFAVSPTGPLDDNIDLVAFLASGVDFTTSEMVYVTNGSITETSSITFNDFTGTAEVYGNIEVDQPLPEPSSLLLIGTGVLGASGLLRKRLRHQAS
jgi:hypothetical protein